MKKTLSLMLALAKVFALVLVAAPAAEAATPCDHTDHTGWTAWSTTADPIVAIDSDKGLAGGKYYLTEDVTVTERIMIKADEEVTICLNGHKLTVNPTGASSGTPTALGCFDTKTGSAGVTKLNFCDCSATKTGVVERTTMPEAGRFGAVALARKNAEINFYGGTFKLTVENKSSTSPSMVHCNDKSGVINIYEGAKFEHVNGMTVKSKGTVNVYGVGSNITFTGDGADAKVVVDGVDKTATADATTKLVSIAAFAPTPAPGGSTNPSTGDSANLVVMGLGLILGVAGMACLLPKKQTV